VLIAVRRYLQYLLGHSNNKALLSCTWYLTGGPFFSGLATSYYVVQANVESGQITTHYNCHNQVLYVPRTQAFPGSECQRYNGTSGTSSHRPSIQDDTTARPERDLATRTKLCTALSCWVLFFWPFGWCCAGLRSVRCCAVLCWCLC
jgi:hypothetical protein